MPRRSAISLGSAAVRRWSDLRFVPLWAIGREQGIRARKKYQREREVHLPSSPYTVRKLMLRCQPNTASSYWPLFFYRIQGGYEESLGWP